MKWYYVPRTAWFNHHKYDVDGITRILARHHLVRIRLEPTHGWTNQGEVVCFQTKKWDLGPLTKALQEHFGTEWIFVWGKTWACPKKLQVDYDTTRSTQAFYELQRKGRKKDRVKTSTHS
jgi:hypothetical protein